MGTTAQEFGNSHVTHDFAMCYNIAQQILHSNTILMNWLLSNYACPMSLPQMYASGCLSSYPVGDGDIKMERDLVEEESADDFSRTVVSKEIHMSQCEDSKAEEEYVFHGSNGFLNDLHDSVDANCVICCESIHCGYGHSSLDLCRDCFQINSKYLVSRGDEQPEVSEEVGNALSELHGCLRNFEKSY